jgi:sulfonate transport system substrate-binding protein
LTITKLWAVFIVVAAAVIVGAAYYYYTTLTAPAPITVRIGVAHPYESVNFATYFVVLPRGLFDKWGVKCEVTTIAGGSGEVVKALETGAIDVGVCMSSAVILARAKGVDVGIASTISSGNALSMLVFVAPDSPIKSLNDLRGKKIGITKPGSLTHVNVILLRKALGLKSTELVEVPLGSLDAMLAALKKKEVDAALWTHEVALTLEERGEVRLIKPSTSELYPKLPKMPGTVLAVSSKFAKEHPDAVKKVIGAFLEASKIWNEDSQLAYKILTGKEAYGYSDSVARYMYEFVKFTNDGSISTSAVEELTRLLVEAGAIKEPLPAEDVIIKGFVPIVP